MHQEQTLYINKNTTDLNAYFIKYKKNDIFYCNDNGGPQYARVLAFNTKGVKYQSLKTTSSIPIISNLKHYHPQNKAARKMLNIDIRATNIYSLALKINQLLKHPWIIPQAPIMKIFNLLRHE